MIDPYEVFTDIKISSSAVVAVGITEDITAVSVAV